MKLNLPQQVRATLYILTALGTPLVMYLVAIHEVSDSFVAFWGAEVTTISALAAFNVRSGKR